MPQDASQPSGGAGEILPENEALKKGAREEGAPETVPVSDADPQVTAPTQNIAKENADLEARARELGIEIPTDDPTPAGLERCRKRLRELIAEKEKEKAPAPESAKETAEDLASENSKDELVKLAEDEEVEIESGDTKAEIAEKIVAARKAKA
jgi:hypothetical protein